MTFCACESGLIFQDLHTNRFVVLDKDYVVRGYYNGLDSAAMTKLARDIGLLMLEKDKTKKSELLASIINLKWLWLVVVVLVVCFVLFMSNRRKING